MRSKEGDGGHHALRGVRDRLPSDVITSREGVAVFLARRYPVLQDYARRYMPQASPAAINVVVGRVVEILLAIEHPNIQHGLRYARRVVRRECERHLREEQEPEAIPTDPLLKIQITGRALEALQRMGPRAQSIIWKVARDKKTVAEIARDEGIEPAVARQRLHHARRRWLELMGDGRPTLAFLALLPNKLRENLARLADAFVPQSFAATALVPLIALFAIPPSAVLPLAALTVSGAQGTSTKPPSAAVAGTVMPVAAPATPDRHVAVARSVPQSDTPLPAPGYTAASETPDDVILSALGVAADGRPVLVAVGTGKTCKCSVLLQSLDGGATWASTNGPPAQVNQLVLPPTYPNDPRIFAGVDPVLGSSPYMAAAFGQQFQALTALPPGQVAVSAHFDDGDPRLFAAGQTAIWSIRVDVSSPVARDEVDYSAGGATTHVVAALATPAPSAGSPALLAWVPAPATVPGSPSGVPPLAQSIIVACPASAPCTTMTTIAAIPWRLTLHGPTAVLAYNGRSAYISHDGGASFATFSLPPDSSIVDSIALGGTTLAPWVSFQRADKSVSVARLLPSGAWVDASGNSSAARTDLGQLVAVGADRIIEEFSTAGYRCTTIVGGPWASRCPAQ